MTSAPSSRPMRREKWTALALAALFVGLSSFIRLRDLDVFVTPDEMKWVCRSINFYRGILTGELEDTLQTGHPGVITMWLAVPFIGVDPLEGWLDMCENPRLTEMLENAPRDAPARLARLLFAGRRGVVVFTSLAIGAAFLLLARLFDWRLAVVASGLITLDPLFVAHSRLLHLDAIITSLLFLSVLCLAIALREESRKFLAFSGVLAGLATLNKSPAMLSLPFSVLVIGLDWLARRAPFGRLARRAMAWCLPWAATCGLVWPAMWVQAGHTLNTVVGTALFYASNPHTNSNFFLGLPRPDPGPAYYPVALVFRLTPWAMVGALLGLPWLVRRDRRRQPMWMLAGFALLYALFMTVGKKKFDRYLLPLFPFMQTLAAMGLLATGDWLLSRWRAPWKERLLAAVLAVAAVILGVVRVLPHAPYYLTYYSPVAGGPRAAVKKVLVGWGEGLDVAAGYLNGLIESEDSRAVVRSLPDFAPFFRGRTYDETDYDAATTDYVVIYLNEVQRRLSPELLERYYDVAEPLYVARIKGIDYAWVYENKTHERPMVYIEKHANTATDAIVVSRPSLFGDNYEGLLPLYVLQSGTSRQEMLATLDSVASRADRVWYVRYAEKNPNPALEWIDFQLQTHTFLLDEWSFTDVDLLLWRTKDGVSFVDAQEVHGELKVRFGDDLELRGYRLNSPTAQWGRGMGVILEWHVLRDSDRYFAEFIHVIDERGRRWGQGDQWMVNESLVPTVSWKEGDVVFDPVSVRLVPGIPPGKYQLVAGVYDRIAREHLLAVDCAGVQLGDRCAIGALSVVPSPQKVMPEQLAIQRRVEVGLTTCLRLLGWGIDDATPRFGDPFPVKLYWQATAGPDEDYEALLQVVDDEGREWASGRFPLASAEYPTSEWEAGEALWRYCDLRIADSAPATEAELRLALLDSAGERAAGPMPLATLQIDGHNFEEPPISHGQWGQIGDRIRFLGFDVEPTSVRPGDSLTLTLYWRAEEQVSESYTVFTHLLDPEGIVRGLRDNLPLSGRYPTNRWRLDETVVDQYVIEVAQDAPAGDYQIEIGMYDPADGARRIPLFGAQGARQRDDRLIVDVAIHVGP